MSVFTFLPLLWAQANPANAAQAAAAAAAPAPAPAPPGFVTKWLYLLGDPSMTLMGLAGGALTWIKAIALLCLVSWVGSWLVIAVKERVVGNGKWYDYLGLIGLILTPVAVLIRVLETVEKIPVYSVSSVPVVALIGFAGVLLLLFWVEIAIWRAVRRFGTFPDQLVLYALHIAFAFGLFMGSTLMPLRLQVLGVPDSAWTWRDGLVFGASLSATYMGLITLVRVATLFLYELIAVRGRRLYSIARLSVYEANRRMWAPWVVLTVFLLVLAFTHWFLQAPRAAEMGRLFVSTLTLLCSLLLTVMVTILTPLSLPTDIQQQTIYTVVSKPVRRLEMIWGRMLGFMAIVTVLILIFGGVSLLYLKRTVGLTIDATYAAARKAQEENRMDAFKQYMEQADQLRTRMAARVPVKGSLSFLDSRGTPHAMGIDVGQEQSMKEPRSHIEGATPATAIWSFGVVPDPFTLPGQRPVLLDRRIPVSSFLVPGTVEGLLNQVYEIQYQITAAEQEKAAPNVAASRVSQLDASIQRNRAELERVRTEYEALKKKADDLAAQGTEESQKAASALHSPNVTVEMTFNVYRTTKGRLGEPVHAEIQITNPRTGDVYQNIIDVKEYYTNRETFRPDVLAGSMGALKIEVRCLSPTQYLGMAESDLFLLADQGNFGLNFMKGLFGVWLQAMVLTAIGVCAGTFLSWPVALLTTVAFFIAGQLAYSFLVDFTRQAILGGGPFESLIRLLTHDNQMSDLAPTAGVVLAKTLDSLVMPVMSMLVYIVPNFQALDVSNTVADGFAVSWYLIGVNTLLALAYALPFSIAGYFILKNREVAA
jgi:ABC-type transport system involved in multi-copper enzyme maturation permease subunit